MENDWAEYAGDWDKNEDARSYSKLAFDSLTGLLDIQDKNIIDFGCGTGLLTEKMALLTRKVVAIDSSWSMIDVLVKKCFTNVSIINDLLTKESIVRNSLKESTFDIVVASSVFGFIDDYEATMKSLKTLLVNGGYLVHWDWLSENNPKFGLYEKQVRTALEKSGLNNISVTKSFSLPTSKGEIPVVMGAGQKGG